jgi:hypothetical protein
MQRSREERRSKLLERATERGNTKQRPNEANDKDVIPMGKLPEEAAPAPVASTIVSRKGSLPTPRSEEQEEIEKLRVRLIPHPSRARRGRTLTDA